MMSFLRIKTLLLVTAVVEVLGALTILIKPDLMLNISNANTSTLAVCRMFGLAILILGVVVYQVWKIFDKQPQISRVIYAIMMIYHLLIGFIINSFMTLGVYVNQWAAYFHWALAIIMMFGLLLNKEEREINTK